MRSVTRTPTVGAPVTTYEWNWMDKLARVVRGGTQLAEFTYDGEGVRRSAQFASGTTGLVYDGVRVIAETDSAGVLQAYYVIGGRTVSRLTASTVRYYHGDGLASVKALTDNGSLVTDDYSYDAWGNPLLQPGATAQPYQYVGGLGYYTHYQEPLFDQLQLGARSYDPGIGRFTSRDPVKEGLVEYVYVDNQPTSASDPSGLARVTEYCVDAGPCVITQEGQWEYWSETWVPFIYPKGPFTGLSIPLVGVRIYKKVDRGWQWVTCYVRVADCSGLRFYGPVKHKRPCHHTHWDVDEISGQWPGPGRDFGWPQLGQGPLIGP